MMIKKGIIIVVLLGLIFSSCKKNESEARLKKQSTETVFGTYEGKLPCVDCYGIVQKLTLNKDSTFTKENIYKVDGDEKSTICKGTFTVKNNQLRLSSRNEPSLYIIGGSYLEQLSIESDRIESTLSYKLFKKK